MRRKERKAEEEFAPKKKDTAPSSNPLSKLFHQKILTQLDTECLDHFISYPKLNVVNLLICERTVHAPVGYAIALAVFSGLGI